MEPRRRLSASARRERIVEAALALFAERGYAATSMAQIAAASGIARTVLYDHFRSKRDLYLTLLEEESQALLADVAGRIRGAGDPGERMRSTIDAFLASVHDHPFAWRMVLRDSTGDPAVVAAHRAIAAADTAAVRALLGPDIARSGIDPDSERAAIGVELMVNGVLGIALWWRDHPEVAREVLVDAAMDVLWTGLAPLTTDRSVG